MGTSPSIEQIVEDFTYVEQHGVSPDRIMEVLHLAYQYDMQLEETKEFNDDKTDGK